ncbi:MAG: sodium:calcium antiporter [Myxococcota bacterium]
MSIALALALCLAGVALVIWSAERLVAGVVGTSIGFGVSPFVVSVVFVGFDPENLAVGAVGSAEGLPGIAAGSVIGAAMVAVGLAFGVTALLAPMRFAQVPRRVLLVPVLAVLLFSALAIDGILSRVDGAVLFVAFALSVFELLRLSRRGLDIRPVGEVAESLERARPARARALGLLALSLTGLVVGSELLVAGSERVVAHLALSETAYGMTLLALAVSVEELARELPAARRGRPEITVGNVAGSILAFFLCNAGLIALIHPVAIDPSVIRFFLPVLLLTVAFVTGCLATLRVPRWAGGVLVAAYIVFFVGAYLG